MNKKCRVIIPAAGSGSRSGLSYPKTLYPLDGTPILIRICNAFQPYDDHPVIIINPAHEQQFNEVLNKYNIKALLLFQKEPLGMGDALLQAKDHISDQEDILLVWSDIPLLSPLTIKHLVNCHHVAGNDFSLATSINKDCYTIVERKNGRVKKVIETRAMGMTPGKNTERDIGLFIFTKEKVFRLLEENKLVTEVDGKKEHGFLYIIERLVENGLKVEGYPVAVESDLLSFNSRDDLTEIESYIRKGS